MRGRTETTRLLLLLPPSLHPGADLRRRALGPAAHFVSFLGSSRIFASWHAVLVGLPRQSLKFLKPRTIPLPGPITRKKLFIVSFCDDLDECDDIRLLDHFYTEY